MAVSSADLMAGSSVIQVKVSMILDGLRGFSLSVHERVSELPASGHIYMRWKVRGPSRRLPIWNKES